MLQTFLVTEIYTFFLLFCRIGSGIMLLPGTGESYVPPYTRLMLTGWICLLLTPVTLSHIPALPASVLSLALALSGEIIVGVFLGGVCRMLLGVINTAGMILSTQAGVASAVVFDVTESSQGSILGNLMAILVIVLIFAMNLHHVMLRGLIESYQIFPVGALPPLGAFSEHTARIAADVFRAAVQISAPLIVSGTLLFLGAGILSRLMPSIQIFFVIVAPQLLLGFFVLLASFSAAMAYFMAFYQDKLLGLFGGG